MRKIIAGFLVLISCSCLFAEEDLKKLLFSATDLSRVNTGEIVSRMFLKFNATNENTDQIISIPKTKYTNVDYSVYESICDEKAFIPYVLNEKSKLDFYNTFLGFSQLKGADYWTFNGAKKVTFILDSYTIESPKKRKMISDATTDTIKDYLVSYYVQEDNKFGKLCFKSELFNEGDNFVTVNSTIDQIFPINRAGEYAIISFFIYDNEKKGFYYYAVSVMRIRSDLILKSGKLYATTFSNRLRGGTVHVAKILGLNWNDKIITWDIDKLNKGLYRNY
ncbi:MAG: hypothetical protein A2015_06610 [Spirochaetes bacterium GWF1_31_7]|nr:MAG: hypothetical protein A2Y30_09850 [Spirochaetes bacterium GWE1_32_154]OHD46512.1 MAG: hypothetical protein A2015_06610 [Spirochaetes bacterium GWF1_31_7]OHD49321.1 MAG: hypothetical protein A2Y29_03605 [Spirochaetes bacterium GWE2_31_10]OHD76976.1 MAG: hypothetical protein A2355_04530 [Spirochaetes bacterium RIFOXYB1_FULL_32_8]HBD96428.1 hypothetical protein [Spirochaetia bacterium]